MNFYVGNSLIELDEQDANVEFSDQLIDFIYRLRDQVHIDMSKLYELDPYGDVEIPKDDLYKIIEICKFILQESLLQNYKESDEGKQMLKSLMEIAQEAISKGLGLISIGD